MEPFDSLTIAELASEGLLAFVSCEMAVVAVILGESFVAIGLFAFEGQTSTALGVCLQGFNGRNGYLAAGTPPVTSKDFCFCFFSNF
jgi:hypothetical protein